MARTRSKEKRKCGRSSLCESQKAKWCGCGGKSGNAACEMDVACDNCERCLRGCSSNQNFTLTHDKESNEREKVSARLLTGVVNCKEGNLDVERVMSAVTQSSVDKE